MQMGVHYTQIELKNGKPDIEEIVRICSALKPRVAMLQRSRGYSTRASITVEQMKEVFARVKAVSPDTVLMVDNWLRRIRSGAGTYGGRGGCCRRFAY